MKCDHSQEHNKKELLTSHVMNVSIQIIVDRHYLHFLKKSQTKANMDKAWQSFVHLVFCKLTWDK